MFKVRSAKFYGRGTACSKKRAAPPAGNLTAPNSVISRMWGRWRSCHIRTVCGNDTNLRWSMWGNRWMKRIFGRSLLWWTRKGIPLKKTTKSTKISRICLPTSTLTLSTIRKSWLSKKSKQKACSTWLGLKQPPTNSSSTTPSISCLKSSQRIRVPPKIVGRSLARMGKKRCA